MRASSWTWRLVSWVSVVATLVFVAGFIYAIKDVLYPSASSKWSSGPAGGISSVTPQTNDKEIQIVALGDSLAKGTGDDTGEGFVRRTVNVLQKEQKAPVKLVNNLGVNGMTTSGLLPSLNEQGIQYALKGANVILLSIGGNDLFQGAQNIQSSKGLPTAAELEASVKKASMKLRQIVVKLHEINPNAQLVYVGLYNPFTDVVDMRIPGNDAVTSWNTKATAIMNQYSQSKVVPTFDLFVENSSKYLSDDHFHPNGAGYEQIAQRIAQGLK
ncbi:lysophospholipase L1-like esterase [Paenibacillus shirakamiensis]|uniref:Lysophospholipase L1-like esterase n=1 Tax=Paenibacillus shirakamiensis TaxID=1265935 RepID=A0ABS4JD29_9BACL|nr:GDSL-type esterase/lipase family protein [Paenibacillus shirakamiensis]MBP1999625.1 lysophospholipase L1-like esterase [Paenibacillus shirakamiensis]